MRNLAAAMTKKMSEWMMDGAPEMAVGFRAESADQEKAADEHGTRVTGIRTK